MKHVTFTRDMCPHVAGETRVLPDAIAAQLEAEGAIKASPPDWPAAAAPPAETRDMRPRSRLRQRADDLLGQTYLTKKKQ
jgi:hypothetical protein